MCIWKCDWVIDSKEKQREERRVAAARSAYWAKDDIQSHATKLKIRGM